MAINPETQFVGKILPASPEFPYGKARDITLPSDGTGTPLKAVLVNDIFGFQQALLSEAAIVPSNTPDEVGASQYLQSLFKISGLVKDDYTALRLVESDQLSDKTQCFIVDSGTGGAFALDKTDTATVDDGGVTIVDANGGRWKRIYSGATYAAWFGSLGDGATDNLTAYDNAVAYLDSIGGGDLQESPGDFVFSASVDIPVGVYIKATPGTRYIPDTGFTGIYMFLFNTLESETSGFIEAFPNQLSGGISVARFDNSVNSVSGVKAIQFAGSHEFENLRFKEFAQSIKQDTTAYSDGVRIKNIHVLSLDADTDYQIDLTGQGDGVDIDTIAFSHTGRTIPTYGLNLGLKQSLNVKNIIGGRHRISNCKSGSVEIYTEQGFITVNSSNISLKLHQYLNQSTNPIVLTNTIGGNHIIKLVDCIFNYGLNKSPIDIYEVKTIGGYEVEVDNCVRMVTTNGVNNPEQSGIRMSDSGGSPITDFNNFSYLHSRRSTVKDSKVIAGLDTVDTGAGSFTGIASASVGVEGVWDAAQTTYYYRAQLLVDPVRDIGRNGGAEVSVTVAAANKAVELPISYGITQVGIVRVYRGTSAGSYTEYADVHIMILAKLYDIGSAVNGITWIARTAAGMDSIQINPTRFKLVGDEIEVWTGTLNHPSTGTWKVGDFIHNQAPSVDGNSMIQTGRVCVTAGTPLAPNTHPYTYVSNVSPAV